METELIIIREKRKNIALFFVAGLVLILVLYLALNSIANRILGTVDRVRGDYHPLLTNVADTVSSATDDLNALTDSGVNVLNTFSSEMPDKFADSVKLVRGDYNQTKTDIRSEYGTLKHTLEVNIGHFKDEFKAFKTDVRKEIDWTKTEIEKWRKLLLYVSSIIGTIVFLTSLQDILENLRWLLSFFRSLFKASKDPAAAGN